MAMPTSTIAGDHAHQPGSAPLAPAQEEELTPETVAALDHARLSLSCGEGFSDEEILREFGLNWSAREQRPSIILMQPGDSL